MTVRLTREQPPSATVQTSPQLAATVTPPEPMSGPLLYVDQTACAIASGAIELSDWEWTAATGQTFTPHFQLDAGPDPACPGGLQWRAIAGWLDHPVINVTYGRGAPIP